jgi:hypothetical protein
MDGSKNKIRLLMFALVLNTESGQAAARLKMVSLFSPFLISGVKERRGEGEGLERVMENRENQLLVGESDGKQRKLVVGWRE